MKPLLPTSLALLLTAALAGPLRAQEDDSEKSFYRVEAIVFTHAGAQSDAWPVPRLTDHSSARDPAWQSFARRQERQTAQAPADSTAAELEAALNMVETIASLESGEETLPDALLYPDPWLSLDELSEPMAQAREQLEQSGAFRVQTWLAWYQPVDEGSRNWAVRIHDGWPVAVEWLTASPTGRLLRNGREVEVVEDLAPTFHFRLDGSIRLRQRQFMHADVSLDWRVPEMIGPSPWPFRPMESALQAHRLDQSRTVRPGRFEYFDSTWLGLLLRLTPYELEPAEPGEGGADTDTP